MNKRIQSLLITVALVAPAHYAYADENDFSAIKAEISKRHDVAVKRLQHWIAQVSIAAENRGYPEGAEYMAQLARDAGFQQATVINTEGKPGVFATLDAGAPKTVGLYFMYDVKQFDPAEWTSPPTEARIVDKLVGIPRFGRSCHGEPRSERRDRSRITIER
jgi:acetylornithine deacetylase/succinyl-diaminopimelate desuccinylase-like protein